MQPFNDLPKCDEELNLWAKERYIRATKFPTIDSWHYPGRTVLIILDVEDEPAVSPVCAQRHK